jgi:hypothetical protein
LVVRSVNVIHAQIEPAPQALAKTFELLWLLQPLGASTASYVRSIFSK